MIAFFARHPTAANLVMLLMLILGISSLPDIKRETFPEFAPPYISARVIYPGASTQEVEQQLCLPIEDALDGLSHIEEIKCESLEGIANTTIKLDRNAPVERLLIDIQTNINAITEFPDEVESVIVQELDWKEPVIDIAVSASLSEIELKRYAESLKDKLKHGYDIALVDVIGFSQQEWLVEVDANALRSMKLSISDVAQQLSSQTVQLPGGTLETSHRDILVRFDNRQYSIDQLNNIVIKARSDGAQATLQSIATITEQFEDKDKRTLFDDQPAAFIKIYKRKVDDALRIKDQVANFVEVEQSIAPKGVSLTLSNDLSSVLWDRLSMMAKNGAQGIALVFVTMWLFFSFRYSLWIALGLPVAFLGGLFVMAQLGLSINIMSLVGLLMAIGIMMDDSIVIAESVAAHVERGKNVNEAVLQGVKKVLPGVLSSFFTTICIFSGLLALDGQIGAVLQVVPQVLIVVLTLSLVEAFWILPHHLSLSLNKNPTERYAPLKIKVFVLEKFEYFRNVVLVKWVDKVVRYRYLFLASTVSLLLISVALVVSGIIRFQPFPSLDGDVVEARIIMPPGTPNSDLVPVIDHVVASVESASLSLSKQQENGRTLLKHVTVQYSQNRDANEQGPHLATVRVDLLTSEQRNTSIAQFIDQWRGNVGDLAGPLAIVFKQPSMGPGGRSVDFRMLHQDLSVLKQASIETQQFLNGLPGVSGVVDNMRQGKPELVITLKPGAESLGVSGALVASQVRGALIGRTSDELRVDGQQIEINVQLQRTDIDERSELYNLPIVLASGEVYPLSQIADIKDQRNYVAITRIDGFRSVNIFAETNSRIISSTDVTQRLKSELQPKLSAQFPGIIFDSDGEAKDAGKTGASMAKGFLLGLLGVFAILSFQFRSYLEPVIVMIAIPLSFIGVILGHGLMGQAISMPSILGFISLSGIVVNDSILLVQYIRHHLALGESLHQSLVFASRERFRAVFLTSITTAAGLLPLLAETSMQAQVLKPLVISIVFGVFSSTLLVIFMVPAAYRVLSDFGWLKPYTN